MPTPRKPPAKPNRKPPVPPKPPARPASRPAAKKEKAPKGYSFKTVRMLVKDEEEA